MDGYPGLTLVTAPATEPITLAEAKLAARISIDDDDDLLEALIAEARLEVETETHRQLVTATYDLQLDCFPRGREAIRLPLAPLAWNADDNFIKYLDTAGVLQTLAADQYLVSSNVEPGKLFPVFSAIWPSTRRIENAVTIRFTCGYGAASAVDERARMAMKLIINTRYEVREDVVVGTIITPIPRGAERLMEQLKYGDEFVRYATR